MTIEDLVSSSSAPIIASAMTISFGIVSLYFKWLVGSFRKLEHSVLLTQKDFANILDHHETKDQTRHEENLYRFEKISVALARMGSTNGTHTKEIK